MEKQKGITEQELFKILSGSDFYLPGRLGIGRKVKIDTSLEEEMDRAYICVKKFEREEKEYSSRSRYDTWFKSVDEAYVKGDSEDFKDALDSLLCYLGYWG